MTRKEFQILHFFISRTLEGTWRAMSSTLTAMLSPGRTQHVCVCAPTKTASPLTCVLQPPGTLTGCDTAGAGQHRLNSDQISTIEACERRSRTEPRAQNDLPPSCATGPGPVAHPASRSMTSPSPSVTVMIRPAADETTTRYGRPLWAKQVRHTSQMDQVRMRGEELAVAAPARP